MKGYLTSFAGMFRASPSVDSIVDKVEIPLIQRDYAQGRPGDDVAEIRSNFLEVLLSATAGGDQVTLDFIYGKVGAGVFKPLDGQQRLTTLFLLHWYVATKAEELEPSAAWARFSYATRFSARRFCERLTEQSMPAGAGVPSKWIIDQPWYLHVWRDDPSIAAMLVMLDAIDSEFSRRWPGLDMKRAWQRLTDEESPAIAFYLLPLDDMESDEDLYIKMNSRGKPLTPFENFKARFEQDIQHSARASELAHKIDGAWSDLLWRWRGPDDIVDGEFMHYIDYITEICEFREGNVVAAEHRLGPRARAIFGDNNTRADEHLNFLFQAFDAWTSHEHIESVFDATFGMEQPGEGGYDAEKVIPYGAAQKNLFEACVKGFRSGDHRRSQFSLSQSLLLYGVLLHVIHGTKEFSRRIRILRNLLAASEDEVRRQHMPELLADVEAVICSGELNKITRLSSNQVVDEKLKRELLDQCPDLSRALFRLEDHSILRGTLAAFDLAPDSFVARARAFEAAFADPDDWKLLTGALLATGDYQRQPLRSTMWRFGTGSPAYESVWREVLTNAPRDLLSDLRLVLGHFLDGLDKAGSGTAEHCHDVMSGWAKERERARYFDWRYYLVKYPAMRSGRSGIFYSAGGNMGYMMCMLHKSQRNSLYRDPILLQLAVSDGIEGRVEDPWFTGYETAERWLRLVASGAAIRCVQTGYEVRMPEDASDAEAFREACTRHGAMISSEGNAFLSIDQADDGESQVDSIDRVIVGTDFLRFLIAAGY